MRDNTLPEAGEAKHITEALRRSEVLGAAGSVASVSVENSFATVLSHIFRLRLTYDSAGANAPGSLILKAGLLDRPGGPWMGGQQEVAFYRDVASVMRPGLVPRCFDAQWNSETGEWHLLLEDLGASHIVATQWPLPPNAEQSERIIRARARFHAAWWDDARLGLTVGAWQDAQATAQSIKSLAANVERFAAEQDGRLSVERRNLYDRLLEAAPRLGARYHTHRHMTVVQGDAHVWNCFLPASGGQGDERLFDWDAWRVDVGSDDLAYMMALHWYPELRGRMERRLLDCYHEELMSHSVAGYDRRALQEDYRLSVLWQITTPVWQHAAGIPPVIWWNNFERIHLAVEDLGCLDLLD